MFDLTSRYSRIATSQTAVVHPGAAAPTEVRYVRRRLVPHEIDALIFSVHRTVDGDRLDNLTAEHLGDPTLFWRVCDASGATSSEELEASGAFVRIPAL